MTLRLAERLRLATREAHVDLERRPFVQRLMAGRLGPGGYGALLHNLLPLYQALEDGLRAHAANPAVAAVWHEGLARAPALAQDLHALQGSPTPDQAQLVPAAQAYAGHLRQLALQAPRLLCAHAYVRYLGDLSGGQMLRRQVARGLGRSDGVGLAFYEFGDAAQVRTLAQDLRAGLDRLGGADAADAADAADVADVADAALVDEACTAFARHGLLFDELQARHPGPVGAHPGHG